MHDILNSIDKIKAIDKSGMYDKIFMFPEQLEEAMAIGRGLNIDAGKYKDIKNVVVAGMGGSAIGGDIVRSYLSDSLGIPFYICRHYKLPDFVNENSLVIASSYSGNTEETLSAFGEAVKRGARIFCITTGGKLGQKADELKLDKAVLPTGYQPRAALGFSVLPLLYFLGKIGLTEDPDEMIIELTKGLKVYRRQYQIETIFDDNPAKKLASKMFGRIPIIYTGPELTDSIGTRWKGQICENAECLAFNNQFPEFNHNELVGWNLIDSYKDKLLVIYLRDSDDFDRVARRMSIVKEIIEKVGVEIVNIYSQGDFKLGRIFSLIQIGDFASFYLAILNGIDPTPVKVIDYLKEKLAD